MQGEFEHGEGKSERPTSKRFSDVPRPFLKWVGSKQGLLNQIIPNLPNNYERYFEPFLGGGALFFYERPECAVLSDQSAELISVWKAVRDDVNAIINYLENMVPDRDLYYKIRKNRSEDPIINAGEFLYLNKTCWNGLYRVNSKGEFNVPYGKPRTNRILDKENLIACSRLLNRKGVSLSHMDFRSAVSSVNSNDFVYFDPPYVTKHNNNGFRDWNENLFSWEDQVALSEEAMRLSNLGARVIVSNADHDSIRELYGDFDVIPFDRSSTLSSSAAFRGRVGEVLFLANCSTRS